MIVNKVVVLISPARAREEELISQSASLVFAWLNCRPPRELAAEWTSLDSVGWGGGVPWVSDPLRHPSSLPAPRGRNTQPPLTTGLSRCSLKKASTHTTRRRQAAGGRLIIQHVWKMMHSHGKHLISLKVSL